MDIVDYSKVDIDFIVAELKKGKIFILPTDTSYGVVGGIDKKTVNKIKKIKRRPKDKFMSIFVNKEIAEEIANINKEAKILMEKFWPGALTLVLKAKPSKLKFLQSVLGPNSTIAVREPDNKLILDILNKYKLPVTATSANISNNPPAYKSKQIIDYFTKPLVKGLFLSRKYPDYFIDAGSLPKRPVSTIIDLINGLKVLRTGKITLEEIKKML